jgi:uncharacterized protein YciI
MHFIIHCLDFSDAVERRLSNYDAHKAYLANAKIKILVSGPLLADDHATMIGSFFLVEAEGKEDVVAFNQNDPFFRVKIWEKIRIHPFNKRVDNR